MNLESFLILLGFILFIWWLLKGKKEELKRKAIPESVKREVLKRQDFTCAFCPEDREGLLQFHHKNNNPLDNRASNISILCPNCHSMKTNYDNSRRNGNKPTSLFPN